MWELISKLKELPHKIKRLKFKLKVYIIISILLLLTGAGVIGFVMFEDFIFTDYVVDDSDESRRSDRATYTEEEVKKETAITPHIKTEEFVNAGFTVEEAKILQALEKILGGSDGATLTKYFGWGKLAEVTIQPLLVPAICEELKWGINGDLSIAQGVTELAWRYDKAGINKTTSTAWQYHNSHGMKKGGTQPNQYWDGKTSWTMTSEYGSSGHYRTKAEWKSFKSFWYSFMEHGRMLNEDVHYKSSNFKDKNNLKDYVYTLKSCGYYTTSKEDYLTLATSVYKRGMLDKYRPLFNKVVKVLNEDGGIQTTPNGKPIPEGEWKPQGNANSRESWGYFVDPAQGRWTSAFGARRHPNGSWQKAHGAWDYGTQGKMPPQYAAKSGKVIDARWFSTYGNQVVIDHGGGWYSRHAHLSQYRVKVGDTVRQGDIIGITGNTGGSYGAHVHFEVLYGGTSKSKNGRDPATYYEAQWHGQYKPKGAPSFGEYMNIIKRQGYYGGPNAKPEPIPPSVPKPDLGAGQTGNTSTEHYTSVKGQPFPQPPLTSKKPKITKPTNAWVTNYNVRVRGLSTQRVKVLEEGTKHVGKRYVWGANGPNTFDCSGFTRWVYKNALGVTLPRHSSAQAASSLVEKVSRDKAKPGDLMWTDGHVGIFIRDTSIPTRNKKTNYIVMMHASSPTEGLKVDLYVPPKGQSLNLYRFKAFPD